MLHLVNFSTEKYIYSEGGKQFGYFMWFDIKYFIFHFVMNGYVLHEGDGRRTKILNNIVR